MTRTEKTTRALAAAALLLQAVSCGPRVVVARLATPTAGASAAPTTPTPRPRPRREAPTAPAPAPPTPTQPPTPPPTPPARAVPASPTRPVATATATATRPAPSPTATATARPTPPTPTPTASATATPAPPRPAPPAVATATPAPPATPARAPATPAASAAPAGPAARVTEGRPASFPGEWDFRADAGTGIIAGTLRFRAAPEGLAGVYVGMRGNATELSNLRLAGNRIAFDLVAPRAIWHLEGALDGDRIEGTFRTAERTIRWTATRKP